MKNFLTFLSSTALLTAMTLAIQVAKPGGQLLAAIGMGVCSTLFVNLILAAARTDRPVSEAERSGR